MKRTCALLALVAVAMIWGTTFKIVQDALVNIDTFPFLALRFLLAFIILLLFHKEKWRWNSAALRAGAYLLCGITFQTFALYWTTPGKTAFISGLAVVIVPFFSALKRMRPPEWGHCCSAVMAAIGLGLICLEGSLVPNLGDILALCCAVFCALHIMAVESASASLDSMNLTLIQLGIVSLGSFIFWGGAGGKCYLTPYVIAAILLTAVFATSFALLVQSWAQSFISPTLVALVLSLEPVFAMLYSRIFGDELLTVQKFAGCALIMGGVLLGILVNANRTEKKNINSETFR